jgi:hypothetical protein
MNKPISYYQRGFMEGEVENINIVNKENDRFKLQFDLSYKKRYYDNVQNKSVECTTKWKVEVRSKYAETLSKKLKEGMFVIVEYELKADDTTKEGIRLIASYVTPRFFEEELNG